MATRKAAKAKQFGDSAMAISQEKGEDGEEVAITGVIVGGGPAGMVAALALSGAGFRAIVLEEQPEFNLEYPGLGQALETMEPLCFSAESLEYLKNWGLSYRDDQGLHLDLGPASRSIPFKDIRCLSGRLLRRESNRDARCIRSQDLAQHITDKAPKKKLSVKYNAQVSSVVDISWGAACYMPADQSKQAGDFLLGADGINSVVRKYLFQKGVRDDAATLGFSMWQGAVIDEVGTFSFFDDAIHYFLGDQSYATVYRLPENTVNWTLVRNNRLEGSNALAEWRSMMSSWPVGEDGSVDIPVEQMMSLRESFDLFDTDKSGALDVDELKVAMQTVGMEIPDKELSKLLLAVDKDGSGEFEFVEFVEVVKLLLLKMREANQAEGTFEEMQGLVDELQQDIQDRTLEMNQCKRRVYDMRKGGALGPLAMEDKIEELGADVEMFKEQLNQAREAIKAAETIMKKKATDDEFEYGVAKESLGRWMRTCNSHQLLRRLVLATPRPKRTTIFNKVPLKTWATGRIMALGQAAYPIIPGSLMCADNCVQDAAYLIRALNKGTNSGSGEKLLPEEVPAALQEFAKERRPGACHAQAAAKMMHDQYTSQGVDWEKLTEEELSLVIELPLQPFLPFPTQEERRSRADL